MRAAARVLYGARPQGIDIPSEYQLGRIFDDVWRSLTDPPDDSVPLVRLIEKLCAGYPPTQDLFDELARWLGCGVLELCDDAPDVRIRTDLVDARQPGFRLGTNCRPTMGELAVLAAAFARLAQLQAAGA